MIYALRTPSLTSVMLAITALGSATSFFILSILVFLFLFAKKRKEAILFTFIFLSAAGLNFLLKVVFARPRPTLMPLVVEKSFSFPSGHSMNSMVFFMMMSYFVYRNTKYVRLTVAMSILSVIIVGLIGFSRIYLGAHYPSDVIAGYATGVLWCTIIIMIEKYIHAHRQ
jgi:undecaprenyl-diphosphatase